MNVGGYISSILVSVIDMLVGGGVLTNPVETMIEDTSLWLDILFVVIVFPILEELLFRKIICEKLLALGEGVAVVVSGIIFGITHGNFFQAPYTLLVGIALGFVYVKTGKLIYTIGYHMALNFIGGVFAPWAVENLDLEKIDAVLNGTPTVEELTQVLSDMVPLFLYEMVVMGLATVGLVFLIIAIVKKQIKFESGIIPPAKERLFMNTVCTTGAAALVTIYVVYFIISILPHA
jgi:membrane protease YdiL (CAAX protease family)